MNQAHLHLMINHLPVITTLIATTLLLIGMVRKDSGQTRTALVLLVIAALAVVPTWMTGEGAEEVLEQSPGINEELIEEHEEWANFGGGGITLAGVLAVAALFLSRNARRQRILHAVTAVTSLVAVLFAGITAWSGGKINHPEIRAEEGVSTTGSTSGSHSDYDHDRDHDHD